MSVVYPLYHEYELESGELESKELGTYSSRGAAQDAIARYKVLPGFCDRPDGFVIYESVLDRDAAWTEGFIVANPNDAPSPDLEYDEHGHLVPKM